MSGRLTAGATRMDYFQVLAFCQFSPPNPLTQLSPCSESPPYSQEPIQSMSALRVWRQVGPQEPQIIMPGKKQLTFVFPKRAASFYRAATPPEMSSNREAGTRRTLSRTIWDKRMWGLDNRASFLFLSLPLSLAVSLSLFFLERILWASMFCQTFLPPQKFPHHLAF